MREVAPPERRRVTWKKMINLITAEATRSKISLSRMGKNCSSRWNRSWSSRAVTGRLVVDVCCMVANSFPRRRRQISVNFVNIYGGLVCPRLGKFKAKKREMREREMKIETKDKKSMNGTFLGYFCWSSTSVSKQFSKERMETQALDAAFPPRLKSRRMAGAAPIPTWIISIGATRAVSKYLVVRRNSPIFEILRALANFIGVGRALGSL